MKQILLVVGSDKIGNNAIKKIEENKISQHVNIVIDNSSNFTRLIKLIKRQVVSPYLVGLMFFSELMRKRKKINHYRKLRNKDDLKTLITNQKPEIVLLFRCGLILNKSLIDLIPKCYNIHASKLPEYGGIGTIYKSLKNRDYDQEATLHEVDIKIDSGKVIDTMPYKLNKNNSYHINEKIAYEAGTDLLLKSLKEL